MMIIVDSRKLTRLLELAGSASNYIADVGLSVRGRIPRFAYALQYAKRGVEVSVPSVDVRAERRRLQRYERALRKIVEKGQAPAACERSDRGRRACHCFLCIAKVGLGE